MTRFVGLNVLQKLTAICVVDETGRRLWRGQCATDPGQIERTVKGHAGEDARIGVETGPMTPWLVHELRARGLNVVCLDARHASAALKLQMNKTDQNDAEGLAQIMRTGWYRAVHVKSLNAHRARALLGARAQLVDMTTRLSNHVRGVLKTFGLLPGAMRGLPFDQRVEELLADRDDLASIVRPMLAAWRQLREQVAVFDKAVRALAKADPTCRLLMSVPGRGSELGYTGRRIGAAKADGGTLTLSTVVRVWIKVLAQRRGCPGATARTWPFRPWRNQRRTGWRAVTCTERIVHDRVGASPKSALPRGFAPITRRVPARPAGRARQPGLRPRRARGGHAAGERDQPRPGPVRHSCGLAR